METGVELFPTLRMKIVKRAQRRFKCAQILKDTAGFSRQVPLSVQYLFRTVRYAPEERAQYSKFGILFLTLVLESRMEQNLRPIPSKCPGFRLDPTRLEARIWPSGRPRSEFSSFTMDTRTSCSAKVGEGK